MSRAANKQLLISVSGMRGVVGEDLTPVVAAEYGSAFGSFLNLRGSGGSERLRVCIGRDSRTSGPMLQSAVTAGLCAMGIDVIDLGVVTTPGVGIMVRQLGCAGGVVVTASHNPIEYNGIKLLRDDGAAPTKDLAEDIKHRYLAKNFAFVESAGCGSVRSDEGADHSHIVRVLAVADRAQIATKAFKVVLDSVNGAGGRVTKKLLAELGCEVTAINDEATGQFAHTPEPVAENLAGLSEAVRMAGAEVGFAQDPDADRLAIVDEQGRYIGEEYTLALAAKSIFAANIGRVATNLSTSRMIDDVAASAGGEVVRTSVGEANVAAVMRQKDCILGGEGNGGVIDPRVGWIRDSLVGITLVLQLMQKTGKTISQLVSDIGSYHMRKEKFAAGEAEARKILETAGNRFSGAKVDTRDGYRFDFADGWVHLRRSNTEPVMRVIVEAVDKMAAEKYLEAVRQIRVQVTGLTNGQSEI